ncbi:MAG: HNH endonuclease [Candidatus Marinimicrobia bacterium]|nr:HNH endonuclease [Candidatus Neomarinimicrobiota bacterium]
MDGLLNRRVLVLNQNYQPLTITKTKRAVALFMDKKVEILEKYNEKIHSINFSLNLPSVIRLTKYINYHPKAIPLTRKNLLRRDSYICQYCAVKNKPMTLDHIIPKQRGGKETWENLVAACTSCNHKKNNRTPKESNMPLLRKPKKPSMLTYFQQSVRKKQDAWKPYLFMEQLKN